MSDWDSFRDRSFPELLKAVREARVITQEQLREGVIAYLARHHPGGKLTLTHSAVSQWERGPESHAAGPGTTPRGANYRAVRYILGVDSDAALIPIWDELYRKALGKDRRRKSSFAASVAEGLSHHEEESRPYIVLPIYPYALGLAPRTSLSYIFGRVDALKEHLLKVGLESYLLWLEGLKALYAEFKSAGSLSSLKNELLQADENGEPFALKIYAFLLEGEFLVDGIAHATNKLENVFGALSNGNEVEFIDAMLRVRALALHCRALTGNELHGVDADFINSIFRRSIFRASVFSEAVLLANISVPLSARTEIPIDIKKLDFGFCFEQATRLKIDAFTQASLVKLATHASSENEIFGFFRELGHAIQTLRPVRFNLRTSWPVLDGVDIKIIHQWHKAAVRPYEKAILALSLVELGDHDQRLLKDCLPLLRENFVPSVDRLNAIALLAVFGRRFTLRQLLLRMLKEDEYAYDIARAIGIYGNWAELVAMILSRRRRDKISPAEFVTLYMIGRRLDYPSGKFFYRSLLGQLRYLVYAISRFSRLAAWFDPRENFTPEYLTRLSSGSVWNMRLHVISAVSVAGSTLILLSQSKRALSKRLKVGSN